MIMRSRPANIRLINRRLKLPRLLLALSSRKRKDNYKNIPTDFAALTRSLPIRPMHALWEDAGFRSGSRLWRRGFAPAPPGFCALVPLPMRALCRQTDERGMAQHPPGSVEATESALGLLPSISLSSAQSGLILLRREKRRNLCGGF